MAQQAQSETRNGVTRTVLPSRITLTCGSTTTWFDTTTRTYGAMRLLGNQSYVPVMSRRYLYTMHSNLFLGVYARDNSSIYPQGNS